MIKTQWLNIHGSIEIYNTNEMDFMNDFFAWLEEREYSFVGTTELESEEASNNLPTAMEYLLKENQLRVSYECFLKHISKASGGKADLDLYSYEMFCEVGEFKDK